MFVGRGLQESVHLDVEAEKEWELETENMPMEIVASPDDHSHYPASNSKVNSH